MTNWISLAEVALPRGDGGGDERIVARRAGVQVPHSQFAVDVSRWHAALAGRPGVRVALYFDDAYEFACALFGCWHAGKTPVLLGDAQPATVQRVLPDVDACAGELPGALQAAEHPGGSLSPLDPDATKLVIFTSGSSGQPLAIPKKLSQLQSEVGHLESVFGAQLEEAGAPLIHATVSHQHIYGLLFVTLWPLAAGRVLQVERIQYPEQMPGRLGCCPSVLVTSPAHLRRLPETLDWTGIRANLQAIFSSGGPLPPESALQAHTLSGVSPTEVYGSSETGGVAWRQRALHGDAWTPLPGVRWRLEGETLSVHSAHLPGDDWWETSDRAQALGGNQFLLRGRADRIVKVEEKRVSLVALEDALRATGYVADVKTLLLPGQDSARLAAVVVPTPEGWQVLEAQGKRALNQLLRENLLRQFERVVLPRRFRYLRELPVNTQGKATDAMLSALFEPMLPAVRWLDRSAGRAVAALCLTPELRVFDGHFPGLPVLPGVVQLDWAIAFGRESFSLPRRFVRAEQLKFQMTVVPPLQVELHLDWQEAAGRLAFRYLSSLGLHSSGRLVFTHDDV